MTRDFYELLGVDEDASKEEIRDAFREMVQEYHPDRNDDPRATAQFTIIKTAYDTLKDPSERQSYDRLGHTDYVAKRLDGIPDPSSWPSDDGDESASGADSPSSRTSSGATGSGSETRRNSGSRAGTAGGSSTSASSSGYSSRSSTSTSRAAGSASATGSTSGTRSSSSSRSGANTTSGTTTDSSDRSMTGGDRSSSDASTRDSTGTTGTTSSSTATGAASAAATGGAAASATGNASTSTGGAAAGTPGSTEGGGSAAATSTGGLSDLLFGNAVVQWIGSKRLGWRAIILSFGLYLAGLAHYGYENTADLGRLVADLQAAGTDIDALQALLLGPAVEYVTPAWQYVYVTDPAEIDPSIVFAFGAVVMPLVFFLAIRRTRHHRGRNLSYLFALAVFVPLAVLAATGANAYYAVVEPVPLAAVLLGYAVVPLLAGLVLIGRRFVWTPLRRLLTGSS